MGEYGAYKTRVHSVLKQQKEQRTDPAQLEQAKCALISAHEQIKKLQTHSDERSTEFELIRSEKQKISEDLESTKLLLSDLENSSKNKEKILLERTKKME